MMNLRNPFDLIMNRQFQNINRCMNDINLQTYGIDRLACEVMLEGHSDRVNSIDWSSDGRTLVSGSDDLDIILWDPFKKKVLKKIPTEHQGTIFKVLFLPKCNNTLVASAGAKGRVFLHHVDQKDPIVSCQCNRKMVKGLASSADCPNLIWSACDDGTVNQIDLRCEHKCSTYEYDRIINLRDHIGRSIQCRCIASNPRRTELLALGGADSYARVYDRRKLNPPPTYYKTIPEDCVTYYSPHMLTREYSKFYENSWARVVDLKFDNIGSELLVSLANHNIFTFDIMNSNDAYMLDIQQLIKQMPNANQKRTDGYSENRTCSCCIHFLPLDPKYEKLEKEFDKALEHETEGERRSAIEILSDIIRANPKCANAYVRRAKLYVKRRWVSDLYSAMRDIKTAIFIEPFLGQAYILYTKCLILYRQFQLAHKFITEFVRRNPCWSRSDEVEEMLEDLHINKIILNNDKTEFYFRTDWTSEKEMSWRYDALDYLKLYGGHYNVRYNVKEVNYYGSKCEYIVAGSDEGMFFIWDRETCKVKAAYYADSRLVHVCRTHPSINMLATAGTDNNIKLWSPQADAQLRRENLVEDLNELLQANAYKVKTRLNRLAFEDPLL